MDYFNKKVFTMDGYSDVGNHRSENQDSIIFDEVLGIVILADGMGGHKAGSVASKITTDTLILELSVNLKDYSQTYYSKIKEFILSKVLETNKKIFEKSTSTVEESGMGTTLVINYFFDNALLTAHVGDSRSYLFRNLELTQITKDHSFVQFQLDNGLITEDEFKNSNQKNYLTRAIGLEENVEVDFNLIDVLPNDVIITCSDGLTEKLNHEDLKSFLSNITNYESPALAFVEHAKVSGSKDNISVVITKILDKFNYEPDISFLKKMINSILIK